MDNFGHVYGCYVNAARNRVGYGYAGDSDGTEEKGNVFSAVPEDPVRQPGVGI